MVWGGGSTGKGLVSATPSSRRTAPYPRGGQRAHEPSTSQTTSQLRSRELKAAAGRRLRSFPLETLNEGGGSIWLERSTPQAKAQRSDQARARRGLLSITGLLS